MPHLTQVRLPRVKSGLDMSEPNPRPCRLLKLRALAFALSIPVLVVSAQTSSTPVAKGDSVYAELGKAPKKAAGRRNPLAADPEAVAAGGKLFALHCAECHGEMAEGGKKAPSLLDAAVQQAPAGSLFWLLTNGVVRRGMPVWSKLPEPQRWQLVSFIKSLTSASAPSPGSDQSPHP
jgi:mono/diheme cytochrome c family protein